MKSLIFLAILLTFGSQLKSSLACKPVNCPEGRIFDTKLCQCICDPWIDCAKTNPKFVKNPRTCACECENLRTAGCRQFEFFSTRSCSCQCRQGCLGCRSPQVWSTDMCRCECPNQMSQHCSANQYFDHETCGCKCMEHPAGCCKPHAWNSTNCACECPNRVVCGRGKFWSENTCKCWCENFELCEEPFEWDEETCSCSCVGISCIPNFVVNKANCECECNQSLSSSCREGFTTWNKNTCQCECITNSNSPLCSDGAILDPETCNHCIYPQKYPCRAPQTWNRQNGFCECPKREECNLGNDNGLHKWNEEKCACDCSPPEKDVNCPVDTIFDYASCACICNITSKRCPAGETFDPIKCKCSADNPYANII